MEQEEEVRDRIKGQEEVPERDVDDVPTRPSSPSVQENENEHGKQSNASKRRERTTHKDQKKAANKSLEEARDLQASAVETFCPTYDHRHMATNHGRKSGHRKRGDQILPTGITQKGDQAQASENGPGTKTQKKHKRTTQTVEDPH